MSRQHSSQNPDFSRRMQSQSSQSSRSQLWSSDELEQIPQVAPSVPTGPRQNGTTRLKPGHTGKRQGRITTNESQPVSKSAKGNAYHKIKKIEALQREKNETTDCAELLKEIRNILKDDVYIHFQSSIPGQSKNQVGKAILADGCFHIVFSKIAMRSPFLIKKLHLETLRKKYLGQMTENKAAFEKYLHEEEEKFKKEESQKREAWEAREEERVAQVYSSRKSIKNIHDQYQTPAIPQGKTKQLEEPKNHLKSPEDSQEKNIIRAQRSKIIISKIEPINEGTQEQDEQGDSQQVPQHKITARIPKISQDVATNTSGENKKNNRKSILKPCRLSPQSIKKTVRWSDINFQDSEYMNGVVIANKEQMYQQKKEKMQKQKKQRKAAIAQQQRFLLDFLEINDIYESQDIELVGMIDEINKKYAIMMVRPKITTPEPSFMKTRNSYEMAREREIAEKKRKDLIAIGLMKKSSTHAHDLETLKLIEQNYRDIHAYIDIQNPESFFLGSLPQDSVDGGSEKKDNRRLF